MPRPSVFLELNQAQLKVIARVLGSECSAVELTREHRTPPVMRYAIVRPEEAPSNVGALYAVPLPAKGRVGIHLTATQKEQLKCAGVKKPCDYVEVEAIGLKYGIVVPNVLRYGLPPRSRT